MQLEMNRRQFTTLATAGVAGATGLWSVNSQAAGQFKAGVNYMRLEKPVAVDAAAGQIEVLEFFAYTCIHCYRFEPDFDRWAKAQPKNVVVRRMPVAFNASMEPLQRLYFALETMNLVEQLHSKVFAAFHQEKLRLLDDTSITAWVGKQGVDMTAFNAAFKGFSAAGRARRASQLADAYGLEGTPALGLAGQFYIPGQGPKTLDVAEELMRVLRT
jgi:thiol:disulfide interchange protein DsbA